MILRVLSNLFVRKFSKYCIELAVKSRGQCLVLEEYPAGGSPLAAQLFSSRVSNNFPEVKFSPALKLFKVTCKCSFHLSLMDS